MEEEMTFNHRICFPCTLLTNDLENFIYEKVSGEEFLTAPFDVLNIVRFDIKELTLISSTVISCRLVVRAICNNPFIGKIITVEKNYKILNSFLVYSVGRIQIICALTAEQKNLNCFTIKIIDSKIVSKNILCVAELV